MRHHLLMATILLTVCLHTPASKTPLQESIAANRGMSPAGNNATDATDVLKTWQAGATVTTDDVRRFGIARCFTATEIDDKTYRRIQGKSYKTGCPIPLKDLRYVKVLHYTQEGDIRLGEMICHKDISADLTDIFRHLYDARYPIASMLLVDEYGADDERSMTANNTTCFNYRTVANSRTLSNHSKGRAVDINPLYNPHVKRLRDGTLRVSPATARKYADRTKAFAYKIDTTDLCYKEFVKHGFRWGGQWRHSKDYQHFEKP